MILGRKIRFGGSFTGASTVNTVIATNLILLQVVIVAFFQICI